MLSVDDKNKITYVVEKIKLITKDDIEYKSYNIVPDSAVYNFSLETGSPGANFYYSSVENKIYIVYRALYPEAKMNDDLYFKTLEITIDAELERLIKEIIGEY